MIPAFPVRISHRGQNDFKMVVNLPGSGRARAYMTKAQCSKTKCKYQMEETTGNFLYIYMEIGLTLRCEQSWWMKGICLIWSRGRHVSLSLPYPGPTQGREPTGI